MKLCGADNGGNPGVLSHGGALAAALTLAVPWFWHRCGGFGGSALLLYPTQISSDGTGLFERRILGIEAKAGVRAVPIEQFVDNRTSLLPAIATLVSVFSVYPL